MADIRRHHRISVSPIAIDNNEHTQSPIPDRAHFFWLIFQRPLPWPKTAESPIPQVVGISAPIGMDFGAKVRQFLPLLQCQILVAALTHETFRVSPTFASSVRIRNSDTRRVKLRSVRARTERCFAIDYSSELQRPWKVSCFAGTGRRQKHQVCKLTGSRTRIPFPAGPSSEGPHG